MLGFESMGLTWGDFEEELRKKNEKELLILLCIELKKLSDSLKTLRFGVMGD